MGEGQGIVGGAAAAGGDGAAEAEAAAPGDHVRLMSTRAVTPLTLSPYRAF